MVRSHAKAFFSRGLGLGVVVFCGLWLVWRSALKALAISASVASMALASDASASSARMAAASVASASEVVAESRLPGWPRDQSRFPFSLSFAFQKKVPPRAHGAQVVLALVLIGS